VASLSSLRYIVLVVVISLVVVFRPDAAGTADRVFVVDDHGEPRRGLLEQPEVVLVEFLSHPVLVAPSSPYIPQVPS
jgi:hypothetical protein